jgi:trk system potassium uptake protein TrkA
MSMNVIIAGGGRVGAYLASKLLAQGYNVKVIEVHKTELPRLQKELPSAVIVVGSGTDPTVLEAAGIHQAQVVAAVSGSD